MTIDKSFIYSFAKSTARAAYGASLFRGKNDKIAADKAAVDEMRKSLNTINMSGVVVIGEGELDEAPMLYINEKLGTNKGEKLDIAVDPLEVTNFTAKDLPNALSVIAVAKKNCLLKAPDMYMEKIAIGSGLPDNLINLDHSVEKNIKLLAEAKNTRPENLTACVLQRKRHEDIIESLRSLNVKINFISDGDVSGVISVALPQSKIDIYLGIGGGPEGVLAAAALKCLGCQMQTRLKFYENEEKERVKKMGIKDLKLKYNIDDMVKGDVIFCATGVTDGDLVKGIKEYDDYFESETFVLHKSTKANNILKNKMKK